MKLFFRLAATVAGTIAVSAAASAGPPMTGPAAPLLKARPSAVGTTLASGETVLANGATAYRPPTAATGPLPLIVLLHGAGGYPPDFLQSMEPLADRLGVILIAPHSSGRTWDLIENMRMGEEPWHGADARRLDQSLADLFKHIAVDPSHVVLLGFSDGASYALSLGLANPRLFTAVVALSPGLYVPAWHIGRGQRIFIAHGRNDHVLPFAATKEIADTLIAQGANLRFQQFEGDHQIDGRVLVEGLGWSLDRAVP